MKALLAVALGLFAPFATADLYRWVDPASGSIKYSSIPPPWYGDAALEKRSPAVEIIPAAGAKAAAPAAPATPAAAAPAAAAKPEGLAALEERFKAMVKQLALLPPPQDLERAGSGFKQQLETYKALSDELDRIDPKGIERRRAESQSMLDRLLGAFKGPRPP